MQEKDAKSERTEFEKAFEAAAAGMGMAPAEQDASGPEAGRPDDKESRNAGPAEAPGEQQAPDEQKPEPEETAEPDYKQLYEKEVQRLRSLEGRYRKERQSWESERRELLERLAELARQVKAEPGPAPQESPAAPEGVLEAPLSEAVRLETAKLLGPLVASLEAERHKTAVATAHPDFEAIASDPDLLAWIEEQPAFIASSLSRVVDTGTAEEVIELLDRYKKDRGRQRAAAREEKSRAAAERKARDAAAVKSRSAGPPREKEAAQDFESAWIEAVKASESGR
jgi:hypothetical protein